MATETLTVDELGEYWQNILNGLSDKARDDVLAIIGQMAVSEVKDRFARGVDPDGNPWPELAMQRVSGGQAKPLNDTGLLASSISARRTPEGIEVGTNIDYGRIHQTGGILRPTRGRFLAIPATKEAKLAGSPRRFPRQLAFVAQGDNGRAGMLVERGPKGETIVQYWLRDEVKIPARPYLGFSDQLLRDAEEVIVDAFAKQVEQS